MSVDRSLPLATAFGLLVGCFAYQFLLSEWYPALATAAVYASTAYFYLAFDISLLGTQVALLQPLLADRCGVLNTESMCSTRIPPDPWQTSTLHIVALGLKDRSSTDSQIEWTTPEHVATVPVILCIGHN